MRFFTDELPPSPPDPQSPDVFVEGGNLPEDQAVVWWIVTFVASSPFHY